jgi:hypothetical protein
MVESTPDRRETESVANAGGHTGPPSVTRHDVVLAVIPTAFIVALLVGQLLSISVEATLVSASIVAGLAVADGLFRNPPRRPQAA